MRLFMLIFVLMIIVMSVSLIVLKLSTICDKDERIAKDPSYDYGDCPRCESPIRVRTDNNKEFEDAFYVNFECTKCDWHVHWLRDINNKWKRVEIS